MKRSFNLIALAILVACASSNFVDVESLGIPIDVRYATTNNFMHEQLYPIAKVFLRAPAASALADVERDLAKENLGVKVFDGYRPLSVTKKMWDKIHNPDFVADPAKGSRHDRASVEKAPGQAQGRGRRASASHNQAERSVAGAEEPYRSRQSQKGS